jgi:AcrR family transcriptional regulator
MKKSVNKANPTEGGTRDELIKVAIQLFHEQGAHWVSFQQIAKKVRISQPAVYKHFEDKDDLMRACILSSAQSGRAIIDDHVAQKKSIKDKLRAYLEGNLLWVEKKPAETAIVVSMYYFSVNSAPIHDVMDLIHQQSLNRLLVHLEQGNQEKVWKIKDGLAIARALHDLLMGEVIKAVHFPKEMNFEKRSQLLWMAASKLLGI